MEHKTIKIDNELLFKIVKTYNNQCVCVCVQQYKDELNMKVGDVIYLRDKNFKKKYKSFGEIIAFGNNNKVIIKYTPDLESVKYLLCRWGL